MAEIGTGGTQDSDSGDSGNVVEPARDAIGGINVISPDSLDGVESASERRTRKPRSDAGKPRGPRNAGSGAGNTRRTQAQRDTLSVSGIEALLLGIHTTLAAATQFPELMLSETEARNLANAIAAVQEQYPATRIDPKVACLVQLAGTAGMIYGTRFVAIRLRMNANRARPVNTAPQPQPQPRHDSTQAAETPFDPFADHAPFGSEAVKRAAPPLDFPIIRQ